MPPERKPRETGPKLANGLASRLTISERELFAVLQDRTRHTKPRHLTISYTQLERITGKDRVWLKRVINRLKDKGYVRVLENYDHNGTQTANTYAVVDPVTGVFR